MSKKQMIVINPWYLYGNRICGKVEGKDILTSNVLALDGETVTTESGSKYDLGRDGEFDLLNEYLKNNLPKAV